MTYYEFSLLFIGKQILSAKSTVSAPHTVDKAGLYALYQDHLDYIYFQIATNRHPDYIVTDKPKWRNGVSLEEMEGVL